MNSVIEVNHVSKRFRRTVALDEGTLNVPAGVVFALLGENRAGKTTLIQSMLGLVQPNDGSISVLGLEPCKNGVQLRRQIGYVPDAPALYDWMTVQQIC